jgi:hypothetical protein
MAFYAFWLSQSENVNKCADWSKTKFLKSKCAHTNAHIVIYTCVIGVDVYLVYCSGFHIPLNISSESKLVRVSSCCSLLVTESSFGAALAPSLPIVRPIIITC